MSEIENLKQIACATIDTFRNELQQISSEIWNNPELGFNEKHAHSVLTNFLEKHGFEVNCCLTYLIQYIYMHVVNIKSC